MASIRERARGALLGLAVGDALGAPAENLTPSQIRARWGRITGFVAAEPAGTDDTEYTIFSGLLLARHGSALTPAHVEAAWHEWIADRAEGPFRGAGFSERGTLENLRRGLAAPISAQHRHAWSDGLAMRAAVCGVHAAGRPAEAARLAAIDGSVSHDGEGIYGGQAVAAGVAAAMGGAAPEAVIAAALTVVPDDSWTARSLRRAVTAAHRGERAVRTAVVIGGYPWSDLAPEAVALAFGAYAAADGDFRDAVLTAVNMGRDADTTAAVAGALAGATQGVAAIPPDWASAIGPVRGRCLPAMKGRHVLEIADLLAPGGDGTGTETPPARTPETVPAHADTPPARTPETVPAHTEAPPARTPETVPAHTEAPPARTPETVPAHAEAPAARTPETVPAHTDAPPARTPETVPAHTAPPTPVAENDGTGSGASPARVPAGDGAEADAPPTPVAENGRTGSGAPPARVPAGDEAEADAPATPVAENDRTGSGAPPARVPAGDGAEADAPPTPVAENGRTGSGAPPARVPAGDGAEADAPPTPLPGPDRDGMGTGTGTAVPPLVVPDFVPDPAEEPVPVAVQPADVGGGWAPPARAVRAPGPLVPAVDPGDDGNEARP